MSSVRLKKKYKKILFITDLHLPWVNWKAVKQAYKWAEKHEPDIVICGGDLTDQKIWSRWQASPDDFSPSKEYQETEKAIYKLYEMFPNMHIIRGNHDKRVLSKAIEAGIPKQMFNDISDVFNFDGWRWLDPDEHLVVNTDRGEILFKHGDEMGGTVAAKSRLLGVNYAQGHTHKATITYSNILDRSFFGLEGGTLMDTDSKAAQYACSNPVSSAVGFTIIKYGIPYFIPYIKGSKL